MNAWRLLDPACGCGNFLIIAYRELRLLEIELLKALRKSSQLSLKFVAVSKLDVDQFYGIEINEFPALIAEVALWMMDHIMNNALSKVFFESFLRIPIRKSPHIHPVDALETDWESVIRPEACSFLLGNPPFAARNTKARSSGNRCAGLHSWAAVAARWITSRPGF